MLEYNESEQRELKSPGLVLVVEDDPTINALLEMTLEESGYPVKIAWNGLEALNYLEQSTQLPALILLDLTMPVMDGRQFLAALPEGLATWQDIPVIVLTASQQKVQVGEKPRVVGYLPKPFDLDELMGLVEKFAQV